MEQPQTKVLSLQAAYFFGSNKGYSEEINEIQNMVIEWDSTYTSSLRRGYIVELFEREGIFEEFKEKFWSNGNTQRGETLRRRYLRIKSDYEDFLAGYNLDQIDNADDEELNEQEFAAESDLRDFLANNLYVIEDGLTLYDSGGKIGVEYPIENGRIDILAVDNNNKFVVIELKLSKGRNKSLGQILYYMGWVNQNLGNAPCRGMIIARDVSNELIVAVQLVNEISLYKYHISVSVESI